MAILQECQLLTQQWKTKKKKKKVSSPDTKSVFSSVCEVNIVLKNIPKVMTGSVFPNVLIKTAKNLKLIGNVVLRFVLLHPKLFYFYFFLERPAVSCFVYNRKENPLPEGGISSLDLSSTTQSGKKILKTHSSILAVVPPTI